MVAAREPGNKRPKRFHPILVDKVLSLIIIEKLLRIGLIPFASAIRNGFMKSGFRAVSRKWRRQLSDGSDRSMQNE